MEILNNKSPEENECKSGAPESFMASSCDNIAVFEWGGDQPGCHQSRYVCHICHQIRTIGICYLLKWVYFIE